MSIPAAKAHAVPTSLGSRQWSASTFKIKNGVASVAVESKQEPWSDDEDDGALLSKIQELQIALATKKTANKTDRATATIEEARAHGEYEALGETQPATEAELALVGLGGRKTPSEVSYPTSYTASGDREEQLQQELLDAKKMIEKLAAQLASPAEAPEKDKKTKPEGADKPEKVSEGAGQARMPSSKR